MLTPRSIERAGPTGEDVRAYPPSYYAATITAPFDGRVLDQDVQADACIIGGGYTGLGAALRLAQAGRSVLLLESGPIGWGASGRNGGQVHLGWNQDQHWLARHLGEDGARAMWSMACAARDHLDGLIALDPDACDFRAGLVHADHKPGLVRETHDHVRFMRETYGHTGLAPLDLAEIRQLVGSEAYFGGSLDMGGGHLHPLKLALAMARAAQGAGVAIHPHSRCTGIAREGQGWRVTTPGGTVRAGQVLVATGGYAQGLVPKVDAHVLPINNFIATTAPLPPDRAAALIGGGHAVSDSRFVVYYFRLTADRRLLFGGGERYSYRLPADMAAFVRPHMLRVFPQLADVPIDHAWGGTLSITPHRLPYAAQVAPGLWSLSGFSGLGVVLAPWLGSEIGAAMAGQASAALDLVQRLPTPRFPGGTWLRWPTMAAAMTFFALRDRL